MSSMRRRVAPVAMAIGVGIIVSSGGCNLVVGAGDYKVAVGDSGSIAIPDAEATGDVAKPPPGDDSGTPPGPDGGTTDATTQAETGAPPVDSGMTTDGASCLPSGDASFQQIVRACVLAVACDPLFFDVTASDCITNDYLHSYVSTDCLSKITSCDDYYACTGTRLANATECQAAYTADMGIGSCNGSVATSCYTDGSGVISNCAALGGSCVVYDTDGLGDTAAGCEIASSCTSANNDGSTHCSSSTQVFTCESTNTSVVEVSRETCPAGSTCQTNNGIAGCYATTSSCTTAGSSCASGTLTTCVSLSGGNQQYTSNCAAAGLQCAAGLGTGACTAASGCSSGGCTETCVGNQLQVCIGGAPFLVDCPSLGLPTCNYGNNFNNVEYDYCSYL